MKKAKSLLNYNTIVASFMSARGLEWGHRFSNNGPKVKNVKFWHISLVGKRHVSKKKLAEAISGITKKFDFIDRIEFRGQFGKKVWMPGALPPSIAVIYNDKIKINTPKIKFVIVDSLGRMLNWTKSYGLRFPSSNPANVKVTLWDKVSKPEQIVSSINNGLDLFSGTQKSRFTRYSAIMVRKEGNNLIRV